jgi:hypothetical protein
VFGKPIKQQFTQNMVETYPQLIFPLQDSVFVELESHDNYRSGISESRFEHKLSKYFGEYLRKNMVIRDGRKYPYQPDYIFYYPEKNLCIDIEVDEPYVYSDGKPIHFDNERRNSYFSNKGWGIIRFSEEQVCRYPELCCKVIGEYIKMVTGEWIWIEGFHKHDDLYDHPIWTKEEAERMASGHHRDSYLTLLKAINEETPQICIVADGIYLNKQVTWVTSLYHEIWPERDLLNPAKISLMLEEVARYLPHLSRNPTGNEKVYVEFVIYISNHHSFYNFSFDDDFFYIGNFIINVYFNRTNDLICFKIDEYVKNTACAGILLIADDPAYPGLIEEWEGKNIILMKSKLHSVMPENLRYFDSTLPLGRAIGLEINEL